MRHRTWDATRRHVRFNCTLSLYTACSLPQINREIKLLIAPFAPLPTVRIQAHYDKPMHWCRPLRKTRMQNACFGCTCRQPVNKKKQKAICLSRMFYLQWHNSLITLWVQWYVTTVFQTWPTKSFTWRLSFLPLHASIAMERWCRRLTSVCLSVTLVIPDHIRWGRWNFITRLISTMSSQARFYWFVLKIVYSWSQCNRKLGYNNTDLFI